jgi:hypothetical protein
LALVDLEAMVAEEVFQAPELVATVVAQRYLLQGL